MSKKKTVLVVVAHADDMEFMAAGTVARFVAEKGYDVYEYILTDNSKGSYRLPPRELIRVSAEEAVDAGRILGLKEVFFGYYPDGNLNEESPNVLRGKIMHAVRRVKADIVMGWDPFAPYEDHPDHRVVAMATLEAASFSGNPMFHPEHDREPHLVTEAYWFAKSPTKAECFVDVTSVMDQKIEALLAHDCQMVLTVDILKQEVAQLGVDLPLLADVEDGGHRQVIEFGIRQFCENTGKEHGMKYAEQFRYQKLCLLEDALGLDLVEADF